jgi:hypothetical protein
VTPRLLTAAAVVVAAFVACENPFEPKGDGERIPINLVIEQQVTSDTTRFYSFTTTPGAVYAVFLQSLVGDVWLNIVDSATQQPVASLSASPIAGNPRLEDNAVATFGSFQSQRVYQITVQNFRVGTTARFRFKIYPIELDPEVLPARIEIGDTVAGETIDPKVDIDRFVVHGTEGQEFVVVGETQGSPGSGAVAFNVVDSGGFGVFGYVFADAGVPTLTTGRIRFPGTRDYRLFASSVISNTYPRYHGPYRFWSYEINRAPEHRAASIAFNTAVGDERIDRAGDVDEFTFSAGAGADFNAFVQALGRTFQLEVARPGTGPIAVATSQPSDTALFGHATRPFQVTQAGTYIVRVSGAAATQVADTGAYRVYLYAINRGPEHVPAAISSGDTVSGEDIGLPGDIDEFTFSGAAGAEYNAFLQAVNASPDTHLKVEVVNAAGTVVAIGRSAGSDTNLLRQVTGRFTTTSAETYRLRVRGDEGYGEAYYRSAYRLFLYRVNRAPENASANLAPGDSVTGESIDMPGDVDEYRVVVGETTGVNLVATLDAQPDDGTPVTVQLFDANGGLVSELTSGTVPTEAGRTKLAPGVYKLRVDVTHWQDKPVFRGPYRLWLYRFNYTPELVSDTFAIGDTVSSEVIEPWGDVDRFHFYGLRGQHINVALQGLAGTPAGGFQAWISGPGGEPVWTFASVSSAASDTTLRDHQTMRLDLPVTGWYHVEMTGFGPTRGAYRLLVESLSASPEHVPAALVVGDSVTTESIDTPGDWDEFTVTATPGQDLNVIFEGNPAMNGYAQIRVRDAATGDSLAGNVGQGTRLVGPVRVPAGGQVTVAVYQDAGFVRFCYDATCSGVLGLVGPYAFRVEALNRGPETASAVVTVGDTVRGEAVTPIGDLDEFSVSATPGAHLSLNARLLANPVPAGGIIWLDVLDPTTGAMLSSGSGLIAGSPTSAFYGLASAVVPASGALLFRFRGHSNWGDGLTTAPFEFFISQAP